MYMCMGVPYTGRIFKYNHESNQGDKADFLPLNEQLLTLHLIKFNMLVASAAMELIRSIFTGYPYFLVWRGYSKIKREYIRINF